MSRIGKYELIRPLAEGSTAAVHLAWDSFSQREVALKVITPDILRDPQRGRIYRNLLINEASLAGKLQHPHIVQIFDAVVDERQGYIVMEYVPGGTLERHTSPDSLLPFDQVVEIIFKCTRALHYAHQQGVTHRDIKPANILVGSTGRDVKITDFGAALLTGNDITQVSGVGSPAYMSPQQVREMPLNHQTDIYSLGVVMYQMLTGRLPFQASNNYAMVHQITTVEPLPPSAFRADLPASLDAIVARAMQKTLEARYTGWDEFAHDLAQAFRNRQLREMQQDFADSEKFETLRSFPFFAEFSDVEIWEVVRFSEWEQVQAGTVIMRDGEPGKHLCFLVDGDVKITKRGRMLSLLTSGECFGEMAVINEGGGVRGADAIAMTMARIVTIRGEALRRASEACRMHFYAGFLAVLARRLAMANSRLASL